MQMCFFCWGLVDAKIGHATCTNEVVLCPIKIYLSAISVDINEEDLHRCVDRKDINKVFTMIICDVGKRTSRKSFTHPLAVLVHASTEVSLANPVVIAVHIEVPTNGIGMEGHKDYVG